jgi:hypothetical protein
VGVNWGAVESPREPTMLTADLGGPAEPPSVPAWAEPPLLGTRNSGALELFKSIAPPSARDSAAIDDTSSAGDLTAESDLEDDENEQAMQKAFSLKLSAVKRGKRLGVVPYTCVIRIRDPPA